MTKFKSYLLWLGLIIGTQTGCAQQSSFEVIASSTLPKTVVIKVPIEQDGTIKMGGGAGVFISSHGHILTCAHLFREGHKSEAMIQKYDGTILIGEVLNIDRRRDLALIKIWDEGTPFIEVRLPGTISIGEHVLAIGHPFGFDFTVTHGIVSYLGRNDFRYNMLQNDAAINPGNSGGPLIGMDGKLVGINTLVYTPIGIPIHSGLAFSVSVDQIYEYVGKFRGVIQ